MSDRIKELVEKLNKAAKIYYQEDRQIMTNKKYDQLYDELVKLEEETGISLPDSPTNKVGHIVLSNLKKVKHEQKMLSLDKTKDISDIEEFLDNKKAILSWKLDGLTIVVTYENGKLDKAVTRGNGEIGEDITHNARVFKNLPLEIKYKEKLIIRGEAIIKYSDFKEINKKLDADEQYKNPRNLCSGSVRQLDNAIAKKRNINFYAFALVNSVNYDFGNQKINKLKFIKKQDIDVVQHELVDSNNIRKKILEYKEKLSKNDFASDGLVVDMNDIEYSNDLGTTSKFPKDKLAFKWQDEEKETKLKNIHWSPSRTGLINPVAVFKPVELEGTTVKQASLHNLSILKSLKLGIGDKIKVYKANMIIPQISENLTQSDDIDIPEECPVCSEKLIIKKSNEVEFLYCPNEKCAAKQIKTISHFVSRDALNIEGLSEATIEKFVDEGFIHEIKDIFDLSKYKEDIIEKDGFGKKSYENLIESIENAKDVYMENFIYALGIENVGLSNAKLLVKHYNYDLKKILNTKKEELLKIDGFGEVIADSLVDFFSDNRKKINNLKNELNILSREIEDKLKGKTFVITGSLEHHENRKELKNKIETLGGKVTSSVSENTDYLINNDIESTSSKNKKAKKIGVDIISEEEFLKML